MKTCSNDNKLIKYINEYVLTKDLTKLVKCVELSIKLLKKEDFPIKEYSDYINGKKNKKIGF